MTYSLIPIIGFITLLILNAEILFSRSYPYKNRKALTAYRILLLSAFIFLTTDILWGFLDQLENKTPVIIDTGLYFMAMAFLVFSWLRFAAKYTESKNAYSRVMLILGYCFLVAGITLAIINFFTPVLFSYETASYSAEMGRYAYLTGQLVLYVFIAIYEIVVALRFSQNKRNRHLAIGAAAVSMAIGTLAQAFFALYPMFALGCIASFALVHMFVVAAEKSDYRYSIKKEKELTKAQSQELHNVKEMVYQDPLTGVKSKHAYVEFEENIDALIREKTIEEFALCLFDLNDLKVINDTFGHEMGDKYIIKSCQMIADLFPDTDIYRYGGDEFVVILTGDLYKNRYELIEKFNAKAEQNVETNEPVIAVGFSDFLPLRDNTLRPVFERADERMYSQKRKLKKLAHKDENSESNKNPKLLGSSNSRFDMYEMFYLSDNFSLIDMLNNSNCDEIVEVDMNTNTFKQLYHVAGKFFIPRVEIGWNELVEYGAEHEVHKDDLGSFLSLMEPEGFFDRLRNARIPNFDFAHFRYKTQDGGYRYVEQCVITGVENGLPEGFFRVYISDINNIMNRQSGKISYESGVISVGRDQVTGLLTGKDFFSEGDKKLASNKDEIEWSFVAIDIEHFKFFDEWFGRERGDILLAKIGTILSEAEAEFNAIAGYFGQDDFTIIMPHNEDNIKSLYDSIHNCIASFGLTAGFLPAFGVAKIEKGIALVDAFDRATIAETKAKKDMKNRIIHYNFDMQFHTEREYQILYDFMKALGNDEITFYLQPQVNIENKRVVGAEALSRWIKKDGTVVPPGDFIPVLEKYGFVTDLDKCMWEKVCIWLSKWMKSGHVGIPISLNVSRIDIYNLDIAKHFHDLSEKYHIPHNLLKIEITESAYAETTKLIDDLVKKLRKDNFFVVMDDFGSGYSSLNMLSNLKLDAIKIDAKFLHMEGSDLGKGIHVLESVINLVKTMSLPTIVEGVENKKQCDFLRDLGVAYVQGYYFYTPMPVDKVEAIIGNENNIDARGFISKANNQFRVREFLDKNIYSDSMLNNIIGSVAIYSWDGKDGVDIVRYNQQFFEAVGVPDFLDKIEHIERTMPASDLEDMKAAFKEAMGNKLSGSTAVLRFMRIDGTYSHFRIHFYHIGKKEGKERFYGSAINVTELVNLKRMKELIAENAVDNLMFVNKANGKWNYSVISHGLSDVIGLSPKELEEELNNGAFAKRVVPQKALKEFMIQAESLTEQRKDFEKEFTVLDKNKKKRKIHLSFRNVSNLEEIEYIIKTTIVE